MGLWPSSSSFSPTAAAGAILVDVYMLGGRDCRVLGKTEVEEVVMIPWRIQSKSLVLSSLFSFSFSSFFQLSIQLKLLSFTSPSTAGACNSGEHCFSCSCFQRAPPQSSNSSSSIAT